MFGLDIWLYRYASAAPALQMFPILCCAGFGYLQELSSVLHESILRFKNRYFAIYLSTWRTCLSLPWLGETLAGSFPASGDAAVSTPTTRRATWKGRTCSLMPL